MIYIAAKSQRESQNVYYAGNVSPNNGTDALHAEAH